MDLSIVGCGIQSPTGIGTSMSIANVLAGISKKIKFGRIEDMKFEPVTMGVAGFLEEDCMISDRIVQLMIPAAEEALEDLTNKCHPDMPIRTYIGLPSHRPGLDPDIEKLISNRLEIVSLEKKINLECRFVRKNHCSGSHAISQALEDIKKGKINIALVGGVDSYVSEETIEWLERTRQLNCSTSRGFTPGEAASFCLICREHQVEKLGLETKAKILGAASNDELCLLDSEYPTTGRALTSAMQSVLNHLPEDRLVEETFCTLKGLRHEAEEFAFTVPHTGCKFVKPGEFTTLVQNWGDIGAASVPALISYAIEKRNLDFAKPGYNLIFSQSPGSSRSAVLIQTV